MKDLSSGNCHIDSFIINTLVLYPIAEIINNLNIGAYRDCDIKWLDKKLETYANLACSAIGANVCAIISDENKLTTLNQYAKDKYISYFSTIFDFFEENYK